MRDGKKANSEGGCLYRRWRCYLWKRTHKIGELMTTPKQHREEQCSKCKKIIVTKLFWMGEPPKEGFCQCDRKEESTYESKAT